MVYFSVFVLFVFFAVQEIDRVFVINLTAESFYCLFLFVRVVRVVRGS